jgi:signal transduction histidine kinase
MTLTNRLLMFFLAALAVVLASFSAGAYLLADANLHRQAAERLAALDKVLAAAIEVESDGIDWEPGQRKISGPDGGFYWQLRDNGTTGRLIDGTPIDERPAAFEAITDGQPTLQTDRHGHPWLYIQRRVTANIPGAKVAQGKHADVVVTAAVPLAPVRDTLNTLALILVGLSVSILAIALVAGRAVCRRALAPVTEMATAARHMGAAHFDERLPVSTTGDELADLGKSFNGLLDRLHESFERQRRFTGDAAHQLRTPLTAIVGQADVALRRDRPADEYRQALASVRGQAGNLSRIVDALLFLARVDADAGPPSAERIDLSVWMPEHLKTWAEHFRAGDLHFEPANAPIIVQVPPALLGELVNNLFDNALKYSEPGSAVTIRIGRETRSAVLTVEDRGCGIDPAEQAGLFRPFFRSADARRRGIPGVGLGLAVAARLAKAFGGAITATSEPGRGSRFRVSLPAI